MTFSSLFLWPQMTKRGFNFFYTTFVDLIVRTKRAGECWNGGDLIFGKLFGSYLDKVGWLPRLSLPSAYPGA